MSFFFGTYDFSDVFKPVGFLFHFRSRKMKQIVIDYLVLTFLCCFTFASNNSYKKSCARGLVLSEDNVCKCPAKSYRDTFSDCQGDGQYTVLIGQWGYFEKNVLETVTCPFGYCKCSKEYERINGVCIFNESNQCLETRKGVLCSECKYGYSVPLGSEDCKKCSNLDLLYLLPCCVALSVIIVILLYFNFDAFSGYLNGFLYSYQMMILFIPKHMKMDKVSLFLIYSLSLQGTGGHVDMCLFDGMNNLHKIVFNYFFPGYMLVFTFFMGVFLPPNLWNRLFKIKREAEESEAAARRKSFGRAISFVLVICYSSFTNVTLDLMDRATYKEKNVVYKAAFVEYLSKRHIPYFILAVLVGLFIVILFPMILCFTAFFEKHFTFFKIHRYEPVLNALKSCFKDGYQWFSLFYFVCRLVLLALAVYIKTDTTRLLFLSICCVMFLTIFATIHPYKEATYNFWDIILLTNLCVLSNVSLILQLRFAVPEKIQRRLEFLLKSLIFVPLITVVMRFIGYLCMNKKYIGSNVKTSKYSFYVYRYETICIYNIAVLWLS